MPKFYIESLDFKCIASGEDIIDVVCVELAKFMGWPKTQSTRQLHLANLIVVTERGYINGFTEKNKKLIQKVLLSEKEKKYNKDKPITLDEKHFKGERGGGPTKVIFLNTAHVLDQVGYTTRKV